MDNILQWIQQWYASHCDGDWEHSYGIMIETLDNPGWYITIDLKGTDLDNIVREYEPLEYSENDWYSTQVKDQKFVASGDPSKLEFLLHKFKELVDETAVGL